MILRMKALKIIDLAEVLIEELAPRYNYKPKDIEIEIIGVRSGEKIHESLMTKEEYIYMSELDDMFVLKNSVIFYSKEPNKNYHIDPNDIKPFNSGNIDLLNKKEIKDILIEKKII